MNERDGFDDKSQNTSNSAHGEKSTRSFTNSHVYAIVHAIIPGLTVAVSVLWFLDLIALMVFFGGIRPSSPWLISFLSTCLLVAVSAWSYIWQHIIVRNMKRLHNVKNTPRLIDSHVHAIIPGLTVDISVLWFLDLIALIALIVLMGVWGGIRPSWPWLISFLSTGLLVVAYIWSYIWQHRIIRNTKRFYLEKNTPSPIDPQAQTIIPALAVGIAVLWFLALIALMGVLGGIRPSWPRLIPLLSADLFVVLSAWICIGNRRTCFITGGIRILWASTLVLIFALIVVVNVCVYTSFPPYRVCVPVNVNPYSNLKPDFTDYKWAQDSSVKFDTDSYSLFIDARRSIRDNCVLLVTASDVETDQVTRRLSGLSGEARPRKLYANPGISYEIVNEAGVRVTVARPIVYYVGSFGSLNVVLIQCAQGSMGPSASEILTARAIQDWKPMAVICVGVGFATNTSDLSPGDVLVSELLCPYEHRKIYPDGRTQCRAHPLVASENLLKEFHSNPEWTFEQHERLPTIEPHYGALLTGEKLINNLAFRDQLLDLYPDAIGGEMEGAGIAAAAIASGVPWIVVKGVMDWADGNKNDAYKILGAAAAAEFVYKTLSKPKAVSLIQCGHPAAP